MNFETCEIKNLELTKVSKAVYNIQDNTKSGRPKLIMLSLNGLTLEEKIGLVQTEIVKIFGKLPLELNFSETTRYGNYRQGKLKVSQNWLTRVDTYEDRNGSFPLGKLIKLITERFEDFILVERKKLGNS